MTSRQPLPEEERTHPDCNVDKSQREGCCGQAQTKLIQFGTGKMFGREFVARKKDYRGIFKMIFFLNSGSCEGDMP